MNQVFTEGIRRISPVDLAMAHEMGYAVKLLAHAYRSDGALTVRVHPTMIPEKPSACYGQMAYSTQFIL